ncbi:MAG: DUF1127 domain-containing protein [Alphaproteobacteria bacterium]|nr:DUF1127 domain-containing protein [Alphaproteobacteria bacterium]
MAWIDRIGIGIPVSGLSLQDLLARIDLWRQRARSRRALMWLSEEQLRDIGIDRLTALEEASKPFWRA